MFDGERVVEVGEGVEEVFKLAGPLAVEMLLPGEGGAEVEAGVAVLATVEDGKFDGVYGVRSKPNADTENPELEHP